MNATGSLRLKRGIWQMVFDYEDEAGHRRQKSESTGLPEKGNKRRAEAMLRERLAEYERQTQVELESKNMRFLAFMKTWLDEVVVHKVRENTFSQYDMVYTKYIAQYKPFWGVTLQKLTPALIQSYYNEQLKAGLSPNTIRKHHANIHKCLDYAVRLGLIPYNPTNQTELPPKKKYHGAKAYTPSQTQEMLKVFEGDALETVVWLATAYGMRRSEVCGLRWEAVDFEQGTIQICHTAVVNNGKVIYSDETKTATSCRRLPLTGAMREYLLEVKKRQAEDKALFGGGYVDSGYVCVARDGTPISPNTVTHHFQRVLKANGLPCIRFHDLRHSVVYTLRQGGCDAKDIQSWLGHSDVSTTFNIYGHLLEGDMGKLGNVIDKALFSKTLAG